MKDINLDQLFQNARTHSAWLDRPVDDAVLQKIYETMEWGPTSVNCLPARVVYVKAGPMKDKLLEHVMPGNVEKTRTAPVTAILAYDPAFYEQLPQLFPHADVKSWFTGNETMARETAQYNSALQHGYFILASRAHGLDVGPMAGFNKDGVDATLLEGTGWKSSLLVNLGYGDASKLFPRSPRLGFAQGARILE
ncbi:MAG TPA: malonic semialdehyde reductase [Oligoflexus sp.]|uniref:malonic semialdehyde reductase n=1 Tax=Oligoflexus sp. TaxID=1971216 RepID=UPI002D2ED0D2|nr:malonic semialdehyde reductase [Oligoflexus sp.]HYX38828.1 malonic semialdehyde reductase [Oligoflexus sp.]